MDGIPANPGLATAVHRNEADKVTAALTLVVHDDLVLIEVHHLTGYDGPARRALAAVGDLGEPVDEAGNDAVSVIASEGGVDLTGTRIYRHYDSAGVATRIGR